MAQILTVRDLISIYQENVYVAVPPQYAACRKGGWMDGLMDGWMDGWMDG